MERTRQELFGLLIFTWDSCGLIDADLIQFYNIEFLYESMKKYNGMDASFDMEGKLSITTGEGECEEVWRDYVCSIPEFMSRVKAKFGGETIEKVKFYLGTGFAGCEREEIFEYDDDVTEGEIDEDFECWKNDILYAQRWEIGDGD